MVKPLIKVYYTFTITLFFLIFSKLDAIARAGGGGGGGGFSGGRGGYGSSSKPWTIEDTYLILLVIAVFTSVFLIILKSPKWVRKYKNKKVNNLLIESALNDPLWDKESISTYVKSSFLKIQDAWMKQNMELVADLVEPGLRKSYQKTLNRQQRSNVYNFMSNIKINEIKIIGMEDFIDNHKDTFCAYIKGEMVDLILKKGYIKRENINPNEFEDLYFFIRKDDKWIVNNISNHPNSYNVFSFPVIKE